MSLIRRILLSSKSSDNGKNIMMTSQSNPEVMRICYWKGWAENPSYMTYEEAAAVTDTSAFNSAFNSSNIVYFNEAKYFTGIKGNISFTAPRLREFAFLPNAGTHNITGKFPICYRYDIGVCTNFLSANGVQVIKNPYIAEILVSPNNTTWAVTNGHLGKGQIIYRKSDGAILWTTPDYKGGVIIYPKKYQQTHRVSVSFSYAYYRGHTIVANNFYSGNVSFENGGYYVQKIISFKNTSYYNNSSFPSNIGARVPKSVVKEFIVSADDPKDFMADTNYTTNFLNPDVCNFQLRRVNFGITIYNEKALFPLKGLYADEYFMTKEECAEVTTLGNRFNNSDVEEFTELQYFTSLENIDNAFYGCSELNTITLPSHITTIGNNAFANCTSLESIVIPEGVTTIGNNAFANCTSLTSVKIPSTVTYIGDNAFRGCINVSTITMNPTTAPTLGENVWGDGEENYVGSNVSAVKYVTIKDEYIGYDTDKWNVLFEECGFTRVPIVRLQYLESYLESGSNGHYINTERIVKNTDIIELTFELLTTDDLGRSSFGWLWSGATSNNQQCNIFSWAYRGYRVYRVNYGSTNNVYYPIEKSTIIFNPNSKKIIVNGVEYDYASCASAYNNGTSVYPAFLFTGNNKGNPFSGSECRIYDYVVYDKDGNEVQHLVPALDDNNRPCMYDTISGKHHYNQRTNRTDDFRYA